jgi:hypothetical protein
MRVSIPRVATRLLVASDATADAVGLSVGVADPSE